MGYLGTSGVVSVIVLVVSIIVYDLAPYTDTLCDSIDPGCPNAYFSETY